MRRLSMAIVFAVFASPLGAEELTILSAVGMRQVITERAARFEQETGHRVTIAFDSGAMIVRRIESGERADVVLVPQDAARELVTMGRAVASSVADIASSRVGVAVRKGAPRPDISSTAAFRQTLLRAASIARPDPKLGGSSGVHIARVLERLGIADIVASKTILSSRPDLEEEMPGVRVANGRAEIALHQIQELTAVAGVEVVGPFPDDLDGTFTFSAALLTGTVRAEAGRALIAFLGTPASRAAIQSKGMAPAQPTLPIRADEVTLRKQIYGDSRVKIFLLDIPPGHGTLLHRHDRDMLSVFVSGGKTRAVFDGGAPVDDTFAVGDVRFRTAGFTHSTENRDSANFLSVIFEFVQPQGQRMAPTGAAIRTCAAGDDSACATEQPRFCTTGFCVDEVTMAPGAVKAEAAPTMDRILVPLSSYSLVEQTAGGTPIVHNRKRGEVELLPAGPPRRWTNPTTAPAHYIVVTFR